MLLSYLAPNALNDLERAFPGRGADLYDAFDVFGDCMFAMGALGLVILWMVGSELVALVRRFASRSVNEVDKAVVYKSRRQRVVFARMRYSARHFTNGMLLGALLVLSVESMCLLAIRLHWNDIVIDLWRWFTANAGTGLFFLGPINVYTGLMRSGKSYEVVSEVIVPAIRKGRRVVTNVDGISEEKIHEYLKKKYPEDDASKYGKVIHVTNAQVFQDDFFPYYDDQKDAHTDTIVQPGDLVAIDEAWRFWGRNMKINKNHQSFFLEHGHFTHPETHVACDLVLMIQDMGTLHRDLKAVVAFTARTHKKVSLGLNNTYSLNMYEGNKMTRQTQIGNWTRHYKKDIFPLYSSFKGGAQGILVNADSRQNIFTNKKLWFMLALLIGGGGVCFYNVRKFFHPVQADKDGKPIETALAASKGQAGTNPPGQPPKPSTPVFSDTWRITGKYYAQGKAWVVMSNAAGVVRVESPSMFHNDGLAAIGEVDGAKVTVWSGTSAKNGAFGAAPASTPTLHAAPVEVKK